MNTTHDFSLKASGVSITPFESNSIDAGVTPAYTERLIGWNEKSGIRSTFQVPDFIDDPIKLLWSPDLVPLAKDSRVLERIDAVMRQLMRFSGDLFHRFTFDLEVEQVTPVCLKLASGEMPIRLPLALRRDALAIAMDEPFHATCASHLLAQVNKAMGPSAVKMRRPGFLATLEAELAVAPTPRLRALVELVFTTVTETLITGSLSRLPHDERVHPAVRLILAEHHREEAGHHAVFSQVIGVLWSQLDMRDRDYLGPLFARFICAFLDRDTRAEVEWLQSVGFDRKLAHDIVAETQPTVAGVRAKAAASTVRHLRHHGVLETAAAYDELAAMDLIAKS